MLGLNQQRNNAAQAWRGGPAFGANAFGADETMMGGGSSHFCGTPRLVLGPDGQQLALARKLKQQNSDLDPRSAEVGNVYVSGVWQPHHAWFVFGEAFCKIHLLALGRNDFVNQYDMM